MGEEYKIHIAGTAPSLYPALVKAGLLWFLQEEALKVPPEFPFSRGWSAMVTSSVLGLREEFPMPKEISLLWLSLAECRCWYVTATLKPHMEELWRSYVDADGEYLFSHIIVGMAPHGEAAIWMSGSRKVILVDWMKGREVPEVADRFVPENLDMTLQEYCDSYLRNKPDVQENLKNCGLPPQDLFDRYISSSGTDMWSVSRIGMRRGARIQRDAFSTGRSLKRRKERHLSNSLFSRSLFMMGLLMIFMTAGCCLITLPGCHTSSGWTGISGSRNIRLISGSMTGASPMCSGSSTDCIGIRLLISSSASILSRRDMNCPFTGTASGSRCSYLKKLTRYWYSRINSNFSGRRIIRRDRVRGYGDGLTIIVIMSSEVAYV